MPRFRQQTNDFTAPPTVHGSKKRPTVTKSQLSISGFIFVPEIAFQASLEDSQPYSPASLAA
jgi:hypothetical protein